MELARTIAAWFTVGGVVTWMPIMLSVVALYYSRKALRLQVYLKRKEQVALVNLHVIEDGIEVTNPQGSPLLKADVYYHHRWFGTFREPDINCVKHGSAFGTRFRAIASLRDKQRRRWIEYDDWRRPAATNWMLIRSGGSVVFAGAPGATILRRLWGLLAFSQRPKRPRRRRPAKAKYGEVAIAEMFLTDAAREQWYLNTNGAKWHVPRRAIPRAAFNLAWRLRLIGYPFWSNFSSLHWYNVALGVVDVTFILDQYFNEGQILVKMLLVLGARQV